MANSVQVIQAEYDYRKAKEHAETLQEKAKAAQDAATAAQREADAKSKVWQAAVKKYMPGNLSEPGMSAIRNLIIESGAATVARLCEPAAAMPASSWPGGR